MLVSCAADGPGDDKDRKAGNAVQAAHVAAAEIHCGSGVSTYNCPVCRKAQILDLDRLQVKHSHVVFPKIPYTHTHTHTHAH